MRDPRASAHWRWVVLAVGILTQAATCTFLYGLPLLIPALRAEKGLSLLGASVVASAPIAGLLLTLVAWGYAADRFGERWVITTGTAAAAGLLGLALCVRGVIPLCLLLGAAGAAGACVNAASGRVVMGWFARQERGLAMGARQTAQPLGVAVAGLALPGLAHQHGLAAALAFPAVSCAVMALGVCLLVVDPPRPAGPGLHRTARSPYRESVLWRIHLGSALLVIPQFAVASFTLVYLVSQRHWDPVDAGRLIFVFQLVGAGGRVVTGVWSDRVHSRLRPMRRLAVASTVLMTLLAAAAASGAWWIVPVFGTAAVVTVADNGLAYTAVAETAGVAWSGRALGVHNTGQNVASLLTAPLLAAVIGDHRYAFGFALVAIFPLLAIPLTPVRRERHSSDWVAATADQSERIGDRLPFGKARTP